ncbi:tyrosine-type recombinase/integrase [Flavobacterium oreochromis]|nr:tyrosine-type recombinase/integrase [Flavobacterium oreochromis]
MLTQQEIKQLYTKANLQETIILNLCYGCGLRAFEMEQITLKDIDTVQKTVTVQKGKNNKYRVIPLSEKNKPGPNQLFRNHKTQHNETSKHFIQQSRHPIKKIYRFNDTKKTSYKSQYKSKNNPARSASFHRNSSTRKRSTTPTSTSVFRTLTNGNHRNIY